MTWSDYYVRPTHENWQGRADTPPDSCFFQLIESLDLTQSTSAKSGFALLGFQCDEGIKRNLGRIGAAQGPQAIREVLAKMPLIARTTCYDAGDIVCRNQQLESAQSALADAVSLILQQDLTPIILGGGHETAWGNYQGITKKFPNKILGIMNFDAHFDMRPMLANNQGSSGTPFLQIVEARQQANLPFHYYCLGIQSAANIPQLFATAKKYHTHFLLAEDIHANFSITEDFIHQFVKKNEIIYLSLCLDVFAAAYAPGVSAPQSLGLTPWQVIPLLRQLAQTGKVVSYDIAELSPPYDKDQRTAKLAANLVYEIIHHHQSRVS